MAISVFSLLALAVFAIVYLIVSYNDLVLLKHDIDASRQDMDALIGQRHEDLPKLVDYCREKMHCHPVCDQIQQCVTKVYQAHEAGAVAPLGAAETALRKALGVFYQETNDGKLLLDDERFRYLQDRVAALQLTIGDRREQYNDLVAQFNTRIARFPDVLIARHFNFTALDTLNFQEEEMLHLELKGLFV